MIKRETILILLLLTTTTSTISALTLSQSIREAIDTNPAVVERLKNFRATREDLNIAEASYYPQIELRGVSGYNRTGDINSDVAQGNYTNYESSIKLTQNIFNGFSTLNRVNYEESRILSAGYKYIETANDIAFKMTTAYVDVLKTRELLQVARENVKINEDIYKKVKELFDGGLTTDSEVKKIESSLSLARSNLTVNRNTAIDREYSFKRVLGRMPHSSLIEPNFDIKMPNSIERAGLYAIKHNPSLLVSRYNIRGSQSLYKERKKDYYPKIDFEMEQVLNNSNPQNNGFEQASDKFRVRLVVTYNLYRGGADEANTQKHISLINQEVAMQRNIQRQVVEGLELSWNSYIMLDKQLVDLRDYNHFSETTLELYREEYDLGRRTLLDLLTAQNDVISSRNQVITATYDALFAKYRILDAMGLLILSLNGSTSDITARVGLTHNEKNIQTILDTLPIKLDSDSDKIADNIDLCDNSLKANNIMPYGCIKIKRDSDDDGVKDILDRCPLTKKGVVVKEDGCPLVEEFLEEVEDEELSIDGLEDEEYKDIDLDGEEFEDTQEHNGSLVVGMSDIDIDIVEDSDVESSIEIDTPMRDENLMILEYPKNSSYLGTKERVTRDKYIAYFKEKGVKVEIRAYITQKIKPKYNDWLASKRARRLSEWLIDKGLNVGEIKVIHREEVEFDKCVELIEVEDN